MEAQNSHEIATLQNLIHLEYDAIEAYKEAIERLSDANYRARFEEFLLDQRAHVADLGAHMKSLGEDPPEFGDVKSMWTVGKVVVGNFVGDGAILKAMKSNEEATCAAYEKVAQEDISSALQRIVTKNLHDQARHRAWMVDEIENH